MRRSTVSLTNQTCSHGAASPCAITMQSKRLDTARRLQVLIFLILAGAVCTASAQLASPHRLPRNEPLEKYDNPPAYIYRLETSPRMVSPYGSFISYQVNVDASGNN